ncbi:MAG: hypothetical protein L6R19_21220 [Alphaproteobacteria bacterium]|nr:hypothetical protein [Alphaproteobacteria bacterium]
MPLGLTLILAGVSAAILAFSIWRVRRPADPANPRLIDWHLVMLPAILATGLLVFHAVRLVLGI